MSQPSHSPLILIGYRATGKTTVGRILAGRLGREFVDIDERIEADFGGSISAIFQAEGEQGFRDRESRAIERECARPASVISTGGGAVLRAENRRLLRSAGWVIWLTSRPETIWDRLRNDPLTAGRRPMLTSLGGLDEVKALLSIREPLYLETAHLVVDADEPSPEAVAATILSAWRGQCMPS
jgi:shikimate kinase